jgi:hypothetical protein
MASIPISCMWSAVKTSKVSSLLIKMIVDQVNPPNNRETSPPCSKNTARAMAHNKHLLTYRFPLAKWFPTLNMIGLM